LRGSLFTTEQVLPASLSRTSNETTVLRGRTTQIWRTSTHHRRSPSFYFVFQICCCVRN